MRDSIAIMKCILVALAIVAAFCAVMSAVYARDRFVPVVVLAHDSGTYANQDPALHAWFDKLSSGKGLCCSFADGVAVDNPDVDMHDNHYFVRLGGVWIKVDDTALILEPNMAHRAIVWPYKNNAGDALIRCFIPGPGA